VRSTHCTERVYAFIRMSHVAHMNDSCRTYAITRISISISVVDTLYREALCVCIYTNESSRTYAIARMSISITAVDALYREALYICIHMYSYERFKSHIWIIRVAQMISYTFLYRIMYDIICATWIICMYSRETLLYTMIYIIYVAQMISYIFLCIYINIGAVDTLCREVFLLNTYT